MRIFHSWLIRVLLGLLGLGIVISLFTPTDMGVPRQNARRSACQSNLKQIALACKQYTQDYDDLWPLVSGGATPATYPTSQGDFGWVDALQPYLKAPRLFQCPSEEADPQSPLLSSDSQFTDYWFNSHLAKVSEEALRFPVTTFLVGEGNDGHERCDNRYALAALPKSWIKEDGTPASRHLGGGNYAFADGHVKWLQPKRVFAGNTDTTHFAFKPGPLLPVRY